MILVGNIVIALVFLGGGAILIRAIIGAFRNKQVDSGYNYVDGGGDSYYTQNSDCDPSWSDCSGADGGDCGCDGGGD